MTDNFNDPNILPPDNNEVDGLAEFEEDLDFMDDIDLKKFQVGAKSHM